MTSRRRALADLARSAYTAAAGHLEVDPAARDPETGLASPPRWALAPRLAVVAAVVVLLVGLVVALRAAAAAGEPAPVAKVAAEQSGTTTAHPWPPGGVALGGVDAGEHDADSADAGRGAPAASAADAPVVEVVVIHVAGQVARPGVVELPAGSRVHEALAAAGGPTPEAHLAAVNLARPLVDGEQVYVPRPEEVPPLAVARPGAGPGPAALVDLNAADATALDALPGIGPVLAQRIVDWRAHNGRFSMLEELTEVPGIGPTMLERLRGLVTV